MTEITTIPELVEFEKELDELIYQFQKKQTMTRVIKQDKDIGKMIEEADQRIKEKIEALKKERK